MYVRVNNLTSCDLLYCPNIYQDGCLSLSHTPTVVAHKKSYLFITYDIQEYSTSRLSTHMDPLGAISQVVDGLNLPGWNAFIPPNYPSPSNVVASIFPVRQDLNEKVTLW